MYTTEIGVLDHHAEPRTRCRLFDRPALDHEYRIGKTGLDIFAVAIIDRQQNRGVIDTEVNQLAGNTVTVLEMSASNDTHDDRIRIEPMRVGQRFRHRPIPGQLRIDEIIEGLHLHDLFQLRRIFRLVV